MIKGIIYIIVVTYFTIKKTVFHRAEWLEEEKKWHRRLEKNKGITDSDIRASISVRRSGE